MTAAEPAAAPPERSERIKWLLAIFAVALVFRALHLWQLHDSLVFELITGDARSYDSWAREIAGGNWLGSEVFYQAPLYPYFLAVLYSLVSPETFAVRVVQTIVGSASCALLAAAGWRFFSRAAGIAAGLLLAVYAPATFADTTLQKSVLDLFLLCLALWILGGLADELARGRALALGVAVAALVLSRENALVFAGVLAPWLALRAHRDGASWLGLPAIFLAGMLLVLLPVALRNWHVAGEFHLTTSQLGPNLYIGNRPGADGTYAPLLPGRGDPRFERIDATALAEGATGRTLTPGEVSNFWVSQVVERVRNEPGEWAALMARKFGLAFNAVEVVDTVGPYTHAESSLPMRWAGWVFHFGVLGPLALLGVFVTWRDRSRLLPLYGMFAVYAASLVAFYVFGRYRLPLVPFLVLFAAAGITGVRSWAGDVRRGQLTAVLAAVGAMAVFCNWPMLDRSYMRSVTHYNLGNELFALERTDEAAEQFRVAIRLHPANALATHNLGVVLAVGGDLVSARDLYQQAIELAPSYADAHINLARTHWETGDPSQAAASYETGLHIDPTRASVFDELGRVYGELGEPALAVACFEAALRRDPTLPDVRERLGRARGSGAGGNRPVPGVCAPPGRP